MKFKLLIVFFILSAVKLNAQIQSFDVFTYTVPAGWVKSSGNGVVMYTISDEKKGTYCMMALYASRPGTGSVESDFDADWAKIAVAMGVTEPPQKQPGEDAKGWKTLLGTGTFKLSGAASAIIMNTFSSNDKTTDLVFTFNDAGYQKAMEEFTAGLDLAEAGKTDKIPAAATDNSNSGSSGIRYTTPQNWNETKNADGSADIVSPLLECKDYSYYTIHILAPVSYTGSLQQYGHDLHKSRFYEQNEWRQYMEGDKRIVKGIDQSGNEFLSFETSAALFNSDRSFHYGMVYLVRSGSQLLPVVLELKPLSVDGNDRPTQLLNFLYDCNPLKGIWNKFVSSIKFNTDQTKKNYLPEDLLGKWESRIILGATNWGLVDTRIVEKYTFMEDGRYQSQKMLAGNNYGTYSVSGNKITITDASGKSSSYKFKLESLFEFGNWHRELTLYDVSGKESTLRWEGE